MVRREDRDDLDRTLQAGPIDAAEESSYFAGIQAELGQERRWRFKPSIGVKLRSPIDYFVRLRLDRRFSLETWSVYVSETVYWFDSDGTGADTALEFDHQLDSNSLFRAATFARWTELTDYFTLSEVFSLTHQLSDRRIISYQAGIYGKSEPVVHATDYLLLLRYRQQLHSNYLFLELVPEIRYRKENDFHAEHSLLIRLEMVFTG